MSVDSQNPETHHSTPADDFVAQLAERLELPRETTEARLGELLIAYCEVARARTGQRTPRPSEAVEAVELSGPLSAAPS